MKNKLPAKHKIKLDTLKNLFSQDSFISKFHLQSTGKIDAYQDFLGHNYTLEFCNSKRKFELTLCIVEEGDELGDIMSMSIHKLDEVTEDEEDYFTILSWMRTLGKAYSEKSLFLGFYEGDFPEKIKAFLVFLNQLFENEGLRQVLIGEKWQDHPFDWMGMK